MAKVDVTEIDRDFLAVTGLWSELMHILGHAITIHMPSAWMVYGGQSAAFQEGRQLTREVKALTCARKLLMTSCVSSRLRLDQTIKCDREFAHADSGRMPDCIGNRTRGASDPDFTYALNAEGIHVRVAFLDKDRFDRGHIGVHGNVVLAQIGIHRAAGPRIHDGVLKQRERDAPNHSAAELAAHH